MEIFMRKERKGREGKGREGKGREERWVKFIV